MNRFPDLGAVLAQCRKLPENVEHRHFAACHAGAASQTDQATPVERDGCRCTFVGEWSAHTAHLALTRRCGERFIDRKAHAKHLPARVRPTLSCKVTERGRDSASATTS